MVFDKNTYFDLTSFEHKDLFMHAEHVWEVLGEIVQYVEKKVGDQKVLIGQGTIIEEGAFIKGPAIIGKNCFIAHGAYVRENVILGDNVTIGHASEIKNSIILNNTAVAHFNYIGDSIIGQQVNIGGGAKTANLRLDQKSVHVRNGDDVIDTGLVKFGAIVGDGCKIGINAVLNPGAMLGKKSVVYPLVSVVGVYEQDTIIR